MAARHLLRLTNWISQNLRKCSLNSAEYTLLIVVNNYCGYHFLVVLAPFNQNDKTISVQSLSLRRIVCLSICEYFFFALFICFSFGVFFVFVYLSSFAFVCLLFICCNLSCSSELDYYIITLITIDEIEIISIDWYRQQGPNTHTFYFFTFFHPLLFNADYKNYKIYGSFRISDFESV